MSLINLCLIEGYNRLVHFYQSSEISLFTNSISWISSPRVDQMFEPWFCQRRFFMENRPKSYGLLQKKMVCFRWSQTDVFGPAFRGISKRRNISRRIKWRIFRQIRSSARYERVGSGILIHSRHSGSDNSRSFFIFYLFFFLL